MDDTVTPIVNPVEKPFVPPTQPINNRLNFFLIVLGIFILLLIVIGIVYYREMQNEKIIKLKIQSNSHPTVVTNAQPTPLINNEKFKVLIGTKEIFIDNNKLQNPEHAIMRSIEHYELSPDRTKLAVLVQGNVMTFFLYLYDITADNITYIDFADEVKWSNNSHLIAYTKPLSDIGPHHFNIYNIDTKITKTLETKQSDNPTKYSNISWNQDDISLTADYYSYKIPGGEEISSGKNTYLLSEFK
jgi:hypothetical protein